MSKAYDKASKFLDEALSQLGLTDDSPYDHANQNTTEMSYGPDDYPRGPRIDWSRHRRDVIPYNNTRVQFVSREEWAREADEVLLDRLTSCTAPFTHCHEATDSRSLLEATMRVIEQMRPTNIPSHIWEDEL